MKLKLIAAVLSVFVLLIACNSGEGTGKAVLKSNTDTMSYAIGLNVGLQIAKDTVLPNKDLVVAGLLAGIKNDTSLMNSEQIRKAMMDFQNYMMEQEKKKRDALGAKNLEEGKKFLEQNKTKEGVVTTPSGLQYKVITPGDGSSPVSNSTVKVHYTGKLLDGKVFDSSVERNQPAEFQLNRVIKGWTEGLQLMKKGGKFQFFVPAELAYGENGGGDKIGPNQVLVFDVELLEVTDSAEAANKMKEEAKKMNAEKK